VGNDPAKFRPASIYHRREARSVARVISGSWEALPRHRFVYYYYGSGERLEADGVGVRCGEIVMRRVIWFCATAVVVISLPRIADAQDPPQITYQSPGVYSTYGNQTYGPRGELQTNQGNQTYTEGRRGRGPTYSTYGHQTYGTDGSTYNTYGNTTYGSNGTIAQTHGNQTSIYQPNGRTIVCSVYGNQTVCR
jgi:hypothetical protein